MSNEVQIEKPEDGKEAATTTSTAGPATGTSSAAPTPSPLEQTITAVAPGIIASFLESAKKIGMPATVAAIVSVIVTVTPFMFKIDERYAKATELQESIDRNKEDLAKLTAEVGKVAGAVDVLSQIVGQQYQQIQEMNRLQRLARLRTEQDGGIQRQQEILAPAPIIEPEEEYGYAEYEDNDVPHSGGDRFDDQTEALATDDSAPDAEFSYDPEQDMDESLNKLRQSLDESRKTLSTIQENQE